MERHKMTPLLSVIIPVRNGEEFIGRAIESARNIPDMPLEIVVIDDGSTDRTPALLRDLAALDFRIVVIRRDRDNGAAAARNAGVAASRGEFVCFLDADDVLRSAKIASRLNWHSIHTRVTLSFANYETLLPDGAIEPRFAAYWPRFEKFLAGRQGIIELGPNAFNLLFGENPVCTTGVIARRSAVMAVGGFSRDLRQAEDWDLWIRLARRGGVAYSTLIEALHTARLGSLSTDVDDRTQHILQVVKRHIPFALRHHPSAAFAALSAATTAKAEQARFGKRNLTSAAYYLLGFLLCPSWPLGKNVARATAVLLGLRSANPVTLEQRSKLVSARPLQVES
jgi:GT2 family glycosyltransferase